MQIASLPSLELSWLPTSELKGLGTPVVAFMDEDHAFGGRYVHPCSYGYEIEARRLPLQAGLICVCHDDDQPIDSVLAHEFRHHWQWDQGIDLPRIPMDKFNFDSDYDASLIRYFSYQWDEFDALRFEMRHAASDLGTEWLVTLEKAREGYFKCQ